MSEHPALPLSRETIIQLVEKWKGLHSCIEKVKLFDGRDFERAVVFIAKVSTSKAKFAELSEWATGALDDGALREVAAAHRKERRPFNESEWRFFADERDGLPNEFLGSDSYWEIYPEIRFVTLGEVQPANLEEQRQAFEKYFQDLSFDVLSSRAERWAKTYYPEVPIKRVLLYNYNSKFAGYILNSRPRKDSAPGRRLPGYAIVFDVGADDETATLTPDEEFAYTKKRVRGEIPETPIDRLIQDTQLRATVDASSYPQFLQADFRRVYKDPPGEIPPNSWAFAIKFRNAELQDSIRDEACEPFVVLWPLLKGVHGVTEQNPNSKDCHFPKPAITLQQILKSASPELEELYNAIYQGCINNSVNLLTSTPKQRQEFALNFFDSNKPIFQWLIRSDLENRTRFNPRDGHEREMISEWLSAILSRLCVERPRSKRDLLQEYNRIRKNKNNSG